MALLPEKALLEGSKDPETTTGEFRVAMGQMRDYLAELLGENSSEKEAARAVLGAVSASDIQQRLHTCTIASGTGDAITGVFNPPILQVANGTTLTVRAMARNETATPTFRADGTSALPIVKGKGQALEKGDISGEGHWIDLRYDETLNKWVLLNPENGLVPAGIPYVHASGTADAISARFNPPVTELKDGLKVSVRATSANTSAEPWFQLENFEACPIVKGVNQELLAGDIGGNGHWLDLQYDGAIRKWILQNPVLGVVCPSGVPVGAIGYFATQTAPAGYLVADGTAVLRTAYPDLFAAIGTAYGEGDGSNTFNLPDLLGRFAQGSATVGQKFEAGLPNIKGNFNPGGNNVYANGAFATSDVQGSNKAAASDSRLITFDASRSSPIYGASDTVQPPALTLLPCIKASDSAVPAVSGKVARATSKRQLNAGTGVEEPDSSKAWVSFDASSESVNIKNARNVLDVIRIEKGVFDILFNASVAADSSTVIASSSALITAANRESFTGDYFPPVANRVRVVTGSGFPIQAYDAPDINVVVLN